MPSIEELQVDLKEPNSFDGIGFGMVIYQSIADGSDFLIALFNADAERIENIKKLDVIGKRITVAFPGVREFGLLDLMRDVWRSGCPRCHPITQYKDGRIQGWRKNFVFRLGSGEIMVLYEDAGAEHRAIMDINRDLDEKVIIGDLMERLLSKRFSVESISELIVEGAEKITRSQAGYVAVLDPRSGNAVCHYLTKMMSICNLPGAQKKIEFPRDASGKYSGLWGHSLNTKVSFFTNDPPNHPASKGVPNGHVSVKNFLAVPVIVNGELVGQIAVANSAAGYSERDISAVEPLARVYAMVLLRERDEVLLQASQEKYGMVFDACSDLIIMYEFDDAKSVAVQILDTNMAACKCLGYGQGDLVGSPLQSIIAPDFHPDMRWGSRWMNEGSNIIFETELITKEGKRIPAEVNARMIKYKSRLVAIAVARDFSDRQYYENVLVQTGNELKDALNTANLYKDLLIHDINNILHNILSSSVLARAMLDRGKGNQSVTPMFNSIDDAVQRGKSLVSNVRKLVTTEIRSRKLESIGFFSILDKEIEGVKHDFPNRNMLITVEQKTTHLHVLADEFLHDVVYNIVSNAVIHNGNDNVVIRIIVSEDVTKSNIPCIKAEFIDNGTGIPDSMKEQLFTGNASATSSKRTRGLGIGLSLVKQVIDGYKGEIWVQDAVARKSDAGSNFIILIPLVHS